MRAVRQRQTRSGVNLALIHKGNTHCHETTRFQRVVNYGQLGFFDATWLSVGFLFVSRRNMTTESRVNQDLASAGVTISFGERFQASSQFDHVFKEGMLLVETTASYLDGQGRREAKTLKPPTSVLYATESMRLTTRLLDLASWLLVRRALKEGEITAEEARRKRQRLKLQSLGRPSHIKGFGELPEGLRNLIEESFKLHDRVVQLDLAMREPHDQNNVVPLVAANPVANQMSLLTRAFGGKAS